MTPADCLRLLTQGSLLDPRLLPADTFDQQAKAQMWATAIYDHITYPQAQASLVSHYQRNTDTITVADLNGATRDAVPPYWSTPEERRARMALAPTPTGNAPTAPCEICGHVIHRRSHSIPTTDGRHPECESA